MKAASAAAAAGSAPGDGDVSSFSPLRVGADSGRKLSAFERHLQGGFTGFDIGVMFNPLQQLHPSAFGIRITQNCSSQINFLCFRARISPMFASISNLTFGPDLHD